MWLSIEPGRAQEEPKEKRKPMRRRKILWTVAATAVLLLTSALITTATIFAPRPVEFTAEEIDRILEHSPLGPPPPSPTNAVADNSEAADLGRRVFFDTRFSSNGEISCATCHNPERGWSNGAKMGQGMGTTHRHVPTLWNSAYHRWWFWDGRADSLWMQALQPMEHPDEAGGDRLAFAHLLARDPGMRQGYETLFGPLPPLEDGERFPPHAKPMPESPEDPRHRAWQSMSAEDRDAANRVFTNLGKAIEAFLRHIRSGESPFDRFAAGLRDGDPEKLEALSVPAQRGLQLFVGKANCRLCHSGPRFSDGEFHDLRLPGETKIDVDTGRYGGVASLLANPFNGLGPYSDDPGYRRTKYLVVRPNTWGQFKTPSLRNVAQTAPYMHTGVFGSLQEVLHFYSTMEGAAPRGHHDEGVMKPLRLTAQEQEDLITFLESLTGTPQIPLAELSGAGKGTS